MEINASNYWEECFAVTTDATPTFLDHMIPHILLAGKSMHLIESIGKLKHIQEGVVHTSPSKGGVATSKSTGGGMAGPTSPSDLYQDFLRAMSLLKPPPAVVGSCDRSHDRSCDTLGGSRTTRGGSHDAHDRSHDCSGVGAGWEVTGWDHYDTLINSYLKLIASPPANRPLEKWGARDVPLPWSLLVPLKLIIQDTLSPLLQHHYETVS